MSLHRLLAPLVALALLAGLLAATAVRPRVAVDDVRPAFAATCIGYCKHPTNAGKVFRWGRERWRQEFEVGRLSRHWRSNHPRLVGQQHGMLTLRTGRATRVLAWADDHAARYGRWESRVRAVNLETGHRPYGFVWELVPAGRDRCGGRSIVLASYRPGDARARGSVRNGSTQFTFSRRRDLRSRAWHTYAVEVARDHISWFVDTRVVHTERRDAALSGVRLRPRFRIEGVPGRRMNRSMMQMDWVRSYSLERPNARSIKAPRMARTRYRAAC